MKEYTMIQLKLKLSRDKNLFQVPVLVQLIKQRCGIFIVKHGTWANYIFLVYLMTFLLFLD